jgi:hypothetical protein
MGYSFWPCGECSGWTPWEGLGSGVGFGVCFGVGVFDG